MVRKQKFRAQKASNAFVLEMPEAVKITEKYDRVRFGEKNLSNDEAEEIENRLKHMEDKEN